jgi:hypothetical protein
LPVPDHLSSTSLRACWQSRKVFRESWNWKILARLGASSSSPSPKCRSCWSINRDLINSTQVGRELFDRIVTHDQSWFQYSYCYPSSKMFVWSSTDVIPRIRQAIGTKKTMIRIFITGYKLIVLDLSLKGSKFNQLDFCRLPFSRFEKGKREFSSSDCTGDFLGTYGQFNVPQWTESGIKFEHHYVSRLRRPPYSPDRRPCDF